MLKLETIHKAVSAYGGEKLWSGARFLEAEFSAWGLAFTFKRRPVFNRAKISMDTSRPYSRITPIGKNPAVSGVLDGFDVALEGPDGHIITKRENARSYFSGARRSLYWDDLDMAYFANYAMWNYLTLPALLMNDAVIWKETAPGRLTGKFPTEIPTHSTTQQFRFDRETGLLRQHNYTAEVISGLASAAHVVLAHSQKRGLRYTSHRRVTPRALRGSALPGPTLIEIVIHDCQME